MLFQCDKILDFALRGILFNCQQFYKFSTFCYRNLNIETNQVVVFLL